MQIPFFGAQNFRDSEQIPVGVVKREQHALASKPSQASGALQVPERSARVEVKIIVRLISCIGLKENTSQRLFIESLGPPDVGITKPARVLSGESNGRLLRFKGNTGGAGNENKAISSKLS